MQWVLKMLNLNKLVSRLYIQSYIFFFFFKQYLNSKEAYFSFFQTNMKQAPGMVFPHGSVSDVDPCHVPIDGGHTGAGQVRDVAVDLRQAKEPLDAGNNHKPIDGPKWS